MRRGLLLLVMLWGCDPKETDTDAVVADTGTADTVVDADGDGVSEDLDCDDSDETVYPGAAELCDGIDNNCEGDIDEGYDADADGQTTCGGDCNDADAQINSDAEETCDGVDNDCNDEIDDGVGETYYSDSDSDSFGDPDATTVSCVRPSGYVTNADDCDDTSATTYPGAAALDSDKACMADADRDGYGDDAPATGIDAGTDCNDGTSTISPGAAEICDKVDNDCDGDADESVVYAEDFDATLSSKEWTLNGDASQVYAGADGSLQLTPASGYAAGSAFRNEALVADTFSALFSVSLSGGTGADGMAFLFLNESDATVIGAEGGALGCYGLDGYGLEFDTYSNSSSRYDTNSNHVAVMNTTDFSPYDTSSAISTLSGSTDRDIEVYFDNGDIEVYVDGTLEIDTIITDWSSGDELMFGFSGGTGQITNAHSVDDFTLEVPCSGK